MGTPSSDTGQDSRRFVDTVLDAICIGRLVCRHDMQYRLVLPACVVSVPLARFSLYAVLQVARLDPTRLADIRNMAYTLFHS